MYLKPEKKEYLSFRNEQYIGKTKNLNAQISNIKLHSFRSLESNNSNFSQSLETVESKVIALAQIKMDIELLWGMDKDEILSHDLFDDSTLSCFYSTKTKTNKSLTVGEIEKGLLSTTAVTELKKESILSFLEIFDFMSYVRQHDRFFTCKTFSAIINSVLDSIQHVTEHETIYVYFMIANFNQRIWTRKAKGRRGRNRIG